MTTAGTAGTLGSLDVPVVSLGCAFLKKVDSVITN